MVEVKDYGNVALPAEGQQVLHSKGAAPIIILQGQARLAIVAQPLIVLCKPVQCGQFVAVHASYVNVDLVPVAGLKTHQVQNLRATFGVSGKQHSASPHQ